MGNSCCAAQATEFSSNHHLPFLEGIVLYGDILQSETCMLVAVLEFSGQSYKFKQVDILDHYRSEEQKMEITEKAAKNTENREHLTFQLNPCDFYPCVRIQHDTFTGDPLLTLKHVVLRHQQTKSALMPEQYLPQIDKLIRYYSTKIKPLTTRLIRQQIKNLMNNPTNNSNNNNHRSVMLFDQNRVISSMQKEKEDPELKAIKNWIIPMLQSILEKPDLSRNHKSIMPRKYLCTDEHITLADIVIFAELTCLFQLGTYDRLLMHCHEHHRHFATWYERMDSQKEMQCLNRAFKERICQLITVEFLDQEDARQPHKHHNVLFAKRSLPQANRQSNLLGLTF